MPVTPIEALVYLKLTAARRKDMLDVVELLKAGTDPRRVRAYLERHAGELLATFDELAEEAAQ